MTRVLVVDSNLDYARRVATVLSHHGCDLKVELAWNLPLLRHRLSTATYDLVLADVMTSPSPSAFAKELSKLKTPVVVWSLLDGTDRLRDRLSGTTIIRKPIDPETICQEKCLADLVTA